MLAHIIIFAHTGEFRILTTCSTLKSYTHTPLFGASCQNEGSFFHLIRTRHAAAVSSIFSGFCSKRTSLSIKKLDMSPHICMTMTMWVLETERG